MTTEGASLFCYKCGAAGQNANAYCKRCGEWLPNIKKRSIAFGGDTPQQNVFTGLFMSALTAAVALVSAIALYATYLGTAEAKWSIYLAAAFCLCIAGWQISSFVVALKLRRRLGKRAESSTSSQIDAKQAPHVLTPADFTAFVNAPSVTESTTELLQPSSSSRSERRR